MAGKDNTASDFCQASSLIHLCTDVNTQTNTNGADLPGGNNNLNSKFELNLHFPTKLTSDLSQLKEHVPSRHG
jgi:hypothetical protein